LASQKFASLNFFAGNVAGLRSEIALINKDLPARQAKPGAEQRGCGSKKSGLQLLKRA
jgi:hypothetical protein